MPQKPPFMSAADVRRAFLEFFRERGHTVVPSSSLVPGNDPTLLFTNAGMVQFKDCFLGRDKRDYVRATSSQRCVRAGGKHNDLENVGYTARHHTFFEMLGNFSFGDYFKKDAIRFALGLRHRHAEDRPGAPHGHGLRHRRRGLRPLAQRSGRAQGKDRAHRRQAGRRLRQLLADGRHRALRPVHRNLLTIMARTFRADRRVQPDADGDRWVEIWNLVFMQFDRSADGKLTPLPKPSVDTGAGLERVSAVMQGVTNNYDIDLFKNLVKAAAALANTSDLTNSSLRVIADHIRACTFLVIDGVTPSNEGRGYVLRRIIRRAIRHGYKLGIKDAFFYKLVDTLAAEMGGAFPELVTGKALAARVLKQEEERFAETLANGMQLLDGAFAALKGGKTLDGETVFKLYDTYGFPVDLTADIARERGLVDRHARLRSRDGSAAQAVAGGQQVRHGHVGAAFVSKTRRISSATKPRRTSARWSRCSRAARRCSRSTRATKAKWCSIAHLSMRSPAARWAMRASSAM